MANSWFKFYGQDWLTDPKIIALNPVERLCFITLLCLASTSHDENYKITGLTPEVLLDITHIRPDPYEPEIWEKNLKILDKFHDNGMITRHDNGDVTLTRFKQRQESQLTGYERIKRYREKHKEQTRNNDSTEQKNKQNVINDNVGDNEMITLDKIREDKIRVKKEINKEKKQKSENTIKNHRFFLDAKFGATWSDYMAMRQKIRAPSTERAQELILRQLEAYPIETAIAMLEQSIIRSWRGVFPVKEEKKMMVRNLIVDNPNL